MEMTCGRDEARQTQAVKAVQHIGTNAIPYLLVDVGSKRPEWMYGFDDKMGAWPKPLRRCWRFISERDAGARAQEGFRILGPAAAPAIPDLIRLLSRPDTCTAAARALSYVGKPAVGSLIGAFTNAGYSIGQRGMAAVALGWIGTDASESTGLLASAANQRDRLSFFAAHAVGEVAVDPESVLPVLTNALGAPSAFVRQGAIAGLRAVGFRMHGTNEIVVASLRTSLCDVSGDVRESATNAVYEVAPQVFGITW
jgi:hypothetical protein